MEQMVQVQQAEQKEQKEQQTGKIQKGSRTQPNPVQEIRKPMQRIKAAQQTKPIHPKHLIQLTQMMRAIPT
ncbi:hypothetical protein D3C73_1208290 [compost metagenome]